mmetsp:Transcript_17358/g.47858  ORF Transcript_17358/g.47858 Transcript_17358/m.47858 type:complete len:225 (-) Transcript_17358:1118-1792(-)
MLKMPVVDVTCRMYVTGACIAAAGGQGALQRQAPVHRKSLPQRRGHARGEAARLAAGLAVLPIQPSRRVPGFHAGPQVSIRDSVRACVCLCVCQVLNPLPPAPGRRRLGFLWEAVRFHHCETRGGADGELRTAGCSNPWRPPSASSASFRWARAAAGTWTRACGTLACAGRHTDGLEKRSACCNEPDGSHCRRRLVCTWHPPRHVAAGMKTLSSSSLWSYLARA